MSRLIEMFASVAFFVSVGVGVVLGENFWDEGSHGMHCTSVLRGIETPNKVQLPKIIIDPNAEDVSFHVSDRCHKRGFVLWGCVVVACDPDTTPSLTVSRRCLGDAVFHRHGVLHEPAVVYVEQHCA